MVEYWLSQAWKQQTGPFWVDQMSVPRCSLNEVFGLPSGEEFAVIEIRHEPTRTVVVLGWLSDTSVVFWHREDYARARALEDPPGGGVGQVQSMSHLPRPGDEVELENAVYVVTGVRHLVQNGCDSGAVVFVEAVQ